jgi:outer membrane protein assembly factor BamA
MVRAFAVALMLHFACAAEAQAPPPDPRKGESYDGREHGATWKDDLLVVPQLILTVPRLVLRALFWPIGAAARWLDKEHAVERMMAAMTSDDGLIGVRPEVAFVTGYSATFGLSFFDDKIFGPGSSLGADLGGNGGNIVYTHFRLRPLKWGEPVQYYVDVDYRQRDDYFFAGVGWDAAHLRPGARYGMRTLQAANLVRFWLSRYLTVDLGADFTARRFYDGVQSSGERPISETDCVLLLGYRCVHGLIDEERVPGFNQGTQYLRGQFGLRIDGRDIAHRPTSGALFDFHAQYAHGLGFDDSSWFRLRGDLVAALDLWRRSRVLVLRLSAETVVPTTGGTVPFTELAQLGGPDDLRGARIGKYRDYSSLLATVEYRWPVWMWMDAALFTDWGGVFGKGWNGFDVRKMVPDLGLALRLRTTYRMFFRLQLAYGFGEGWYFSFTASVNPL